jgi:hypothetical protein
MNATFLIARPSILDAHHRWAAAGAGVLNLSRADGGSHAVAVTRVGAGQTRLGAASAACRIVGKPTVISSLKIPQKHDKNRKHRLTSAIMRDLSDCK